jgi:hypothetical protein
MGILGLCFLESFILMRFSGIISYPVDAFQGEGDWGKWKIDSKKNWLESIFSLETFLHSR